MLKSVEGKEGGRAVPGVIIKKISQFKKLLLLPEFHPPETMPRLSLTPLLLPIFWFKLLHGYKSCKF